MQKSVSIVFFIIALIGSPFSFAQDIQTDTMAVIDVRIPELHTIEAYANNPDFIYQSAAENPNSLSQRLFGFFLNTLFRFLNNPVGEFFMYVVLIATVLSMVLALINQFLGGELVTLFKSEKNQGFSLGINKEELESTDYKQLLSEALKSNNYHAATRFMYLIALKGLAQKGLITWSPEKTNVDFMLELSGHPLKDDFSKLTKTYEYVEYGDFEINATQFDSYKLTFDRVNRLLNE